MGVMLYYFFLDGYSLPPIPLCPTGITPRCRKLMTTPGRDRLSPRKPGILRSGRDILPYSFYIGKVCTNNAAEYEALIMGLELALKFKIRHIEIFGNAELVIKQMTTEYEVRYEGLAMYHDLAQRLFECFPDASITHVPRKDNAIADAFRNKGKT
ncbi:hypothetical protein V6N11_079901 [Hibiscus sabdariffa]|uniref:RNase H type-1 domain-containing protein n=1 Tax=Hibiscus sabdariffa TaxID=183260 RepID=A0ABR2RXM4_9ROSI